MNTTESLQLSLAREYVAGGLSVIPVKTDGSKCPDLGSWKKYRAYLPSPYDLKRWFGGGDDRAGIAILGGGVSGGLEMLDCEALTTLTAWAELVETAAPGLVERLPRVKTPRPGMHVYYRCAVIQGNQKLARCRDEGGAVKVLIETRGEGGYVLAPGCPAACHPSLGLYKHVGGPSLCDIPTITPEERELLLSAARSFNELVEEASWDRPTNAITKRPGDDYAERTPWADVLGAGWVQVRELGGLTYWRRPGKPGPGWSATTGVRSNCGRDLLWVFSSNAHPLEQDRSYSKFAAYAVLRCRGDYEAAARQLASQGYGEGRRRPSVNGKGKVHAAPALPRQPGDDEPNEPAAEEPWQPPIPLNTPPKAVPFPLDVLPAAVRRYVEECAWATNSPVDFAAVPALAVAAGAIGGSRRLAITRTHHQPAILFTAIVGAPGSGKSAPLEHVKEPLEHAEHARYLRWKENPIEAAVRRPPPRILLDDTTTEAMIQRLSENPRGLVMIRDELSAIATGLNQYKDGGKGNDRQVYLKLWSGATIKVDRKSNPDGVPLVVRRPCASIVGGIQPGVIEWFKGEHKGEAPPPDDGLLDRFLIAYPDTLPAVGEQWREISPESAGDWEALVQTLLDLEMVQQDDGTQLATLVYLSPCGRAAWAALTQAHANEINDPDFPEWLRGPWSKLTGYAGRLALVLHMLRWVTSEVATEAVDGASVEAAWKLVAYFKRHCQRLLGAMGSDSRLAPAGRILAWIARRNKEEAFSRRDVLRDLSSFKTPESIEAPLRLLQEHNYIAAEPEGERVVGRKPLTKYLPSPLWDRKTDKTDETHKLLSGCRL